MDVFRLITAGYSNAEIGRELFISDTTVKTHVTRLLQKLDLRDRAQAIVLAYQTGLFDDVRPGLTGTRARPEGRTRRTSVGSSRPASRPRDDARDATPFLASTARADHLSANQGRSDP